MDSENLSKKYQLLLQENQLLKERISLLESALKQAAVSSVLKKLQTQNGSEDFSENSEASEAMKPCEVLGNQSNDASFIRLESTKLAEELYGCFGR